jgi:hypothetical protein
VGHQSDKGYRIRIIGVAFGRAFSFVVVAGHAALMRGFNISDNFPSGNYHLLLLKKRERTKSCNLGWLVASWLVAALQAGTEE